MKRATALIIVFSLTLWGRAVYGAISEEEERHWGYFVDAQVTDVVPTLESERITAWVQEVGGRIVAVSGRPNLQYTFQVVIDPVVNAYSGPGGYIYITSGFLLDYIKSEDELGAVLAHEIAHVSARHQVEAANDEQQAQVAGLLLQGLAAGFGNAVGGIVYQGMSGPWYSLEADLLSQAVGSVVTQASGSLGNMLVTATYQGYRREDEQQADALAVQYLDQAGFNPDGFVSVLSKLLAQAQAERQTIIVPHFLASHPDLPSRIAHVRRLIGTRPAR
jgi:predicted Zn-dependent protease